MKNNVLIFCFFAVLITLSCNENNYLSIAVGKFESSDIEINYEYSCTDPSDMKKVVFDISFQNERIDDFEEMKFKISWNNNIHIDFFDDGVLNFNYTLCNNKLTGAPLTFSLFNTNDSLVYNWSLKKEVLLWKYDRCKIVLLENSDYILR